MITSVFRASAPDNFDAWLFEDMMFWLVNRWLICAWEGMGLGRCSIPRSGVNSYKLRCDLRSRPSWIIYAIPKLAD
jgi:hypothetical protein